ncbi:hypothetical protein B0J11DRAFT_410238, partial [Dendryphion nanum]
GVSTSAGLAALYFYLSRYPKCYKLLAQEICTTLQSGRDIRSRSILASCRYLCACIDKSLRMAPP